MLKAMLARLEVISQNIVGRFYVIPAAHPSSRSLDHDIFIKIPSDQIPTHDEGQWIMQIYAFTAFPTLILAQDGQRLKLPPVEYTEQYYQPYTLSQEDRKQLFDNFYEIREGYLKLRITNKAGRELTEDEKISQKEADKERFLSLYPDFLEPECHSIPHRYSSKKMGWLL